MCRVLDDLIFSCTARFYARKRKKWNWTVSEFLQPLFGVSERTDKSKFWYSLSMKRACVRWFSTMADIWERRCIKTESMADIYETREKRENFMCYSAHPSSNMTTKELTSLTSISKEALRELSLSQWPFLIVTLQLLQEDILTSAYSIHGIVLLHNFHFGTSRLLKKFTST